MTAAKKADSVSAIVWKDKVPFWNLTETTAYPIELQQGGKTARPYVYLSAYSADELKTILRKGLSGYRREKQDVEIIREDKSIYTPLFDDHFIELGNSTGTPEQQRAFFDKHPELKPSVIEFTFGGLRMDPPKNADENDDVLDISAGLSGSVLVYQELYDPATDKVVRVDMVHNHAHPTEAQYREYRSARRSKYIRRTSLWTIAEQHSVLEKLYDSVIASVDGVLVDELPCDSDIPDWTKHIPLWHKLWVVDHIFGELVEKNG